MPDQLEAVAANIVHQIGEALYEALPPDVAHDHFVTARQSTNDQAIDFAKGLIDTYSQAKPLEMAYRLVASALMMKRQYQHAGLLVAREFCAEYGIDVRGLEKQLRQAGKPFGRRDPNNPLMGQIDATEGGNAWFWADRKPAERR